MQQPAFSPILKNAINKLVIYFNAHADVSVDPLQKQQKREKFLGEMKPNNQVSSASVANTAALIIIPKSEFMEKLSVITNIEFTPDELKEISSFADKRKENNINLIEFLDSLPEKPLEENVEEEKKKAEPIKRLEVNENYYKDGMRKLKKFYEYCLKNNDDFDMKVMFADKDNDGKLTVKEFEETLRSMEAGMNEEEIK